METFRRDKFIPIDKLVDPADPLRRDGSVFCDDPKLTRMQNLLRYMRRNPAYLPPNPWPTGMFVFGFDAQGILSCAFFMRIDQFEEIPEAELFRLCEPKTAKLYFAPSPKLPASQKDSVEWIQRWAAMPQEQFSAQVQYLEANRWWLEKSEVRGGS